VSEASASKYALLVTFMAMDKSNEEKTNILDSSLSPE
jgi:hypothetical protein